MAHVYFMTFPVSERREARTLGASSAWEVLEEVRQAGLNGLTVQEIRKRLDLPTSTVYNVLQKLEAAGWVEPRRIRKKIGRPSTESKKEVVRTGRMRQIYVGNIPWSVIEFEEKFDEILGEEVRHVLKKPEVVDSLVAVLEKILANLAGRDDAKEYLPLPELCPNCKTSHEAVEYVWALGFGLIKEFLSDEFSTRLKPVLEEHGVKGYVPA